VLGIVELLEVAELWLGSGLVVVAAPALLVDAELCADVVDGFVRSMEVEL